MIERSKPRRPAAGIAANNNGSAEARVQAAVLTLACLLGRQIAREQFERPDCANDNEPIQETQDLKET